MKILLVIGLITLPFALGTTFKCYNCDGCEDPFADASSNQQDCDSACIKAVGVAYNGTVFTQRFCSETDDPVLNSSSPSDPKSVVMQWTIKTIDAAELHFYQCKENLCNGVPSLTPTFPLLIIVISIIAIVRFDQH